MTALKTRFAPSPTGYLHLGHLLHIVWTWGLAYRFSADVILRIEDHDRSRCKESFVKAILDDLAWLHLKPHLSAPAQSTRLLRYTEVCKLLLRHNLVYACQCARSDLAHTDSGELRYTGKCRDLNIPLSTPNVCWRVKIPSGTVQAFDLLNGPLTQNPATEYGDLVIRDRNGNWTYQFCVVIDDMDQGINLVIRGMDLISSVGRQTALRKQLASLDSSFSEASCIEVRYVHHPLLTDNQGSKLSKRSQSESIQSLKDKGYTAQELFALAFDLAGLSNQLGLAHNDQSHKNNAFLQAVGFASEDLAKHFNELLPELKDFTE